MQKPHVPEIAFRHPAGAGGMVEVLRLTKLRNRSLDHPLYASQRRDFHMVQVITCGRGRHHFEFDSIDLRQGDVFHIRPGQVDCFDRDSAHEALLVIFLPEAIEAPQRLPLRLTNPLHPREEHFDHLVDLALLLERLQAGSELGPTSVPLLRAFLETLEILHAEASSAHPSPDRLDLCEQFDELLSRHQAEHRKVAWYADRLAVSPKTLARATATQFGTSPKQHIDEGVALQAKRLLVHTPATIDSIAAQLGFSETTNFVKFFRRIAGCPPRAFRKRFESDGRKNDGASPSTPCPARSREDPPSAPR